MLVAVYVCHMKGGKEEREHKETEKLGREKKKEWRGKKIKKKEKTPKERLLG